MKKLIWIALIFTTSLQAQTMEVMAEEPPVAAPREKPSTEWQNWVFFGISLVTAATGVFVLAVDNGHEAH